MVAFAGPSLRAVTVARSDVGSGSQARVPARFCLGPVTPAHHKLCRQEIQECHSIATARSSPARSGFHARTRSPSRRAAVCASSSPGATTSGVPSSAGHPTGLYWRTHLSRKPRLLQSLNECVASIRQQEPLPEKIDVAMVYVSSAYEEDYDLLVGGLREQLPGLRNVFGCAGFGVVGVDSDGPREVEAMPALSLTLVALPQAEVVVRHVDAADLPDGDAPPDRWSSLLAVPAFPEAPLSLVVLSDPSFMAVQDLLAGLDFAFPTATKIGGLSSAAPSLAGAATATFCWSAASAKGGSSSGSGSSSAADGGVGVFRRGASVMSIHGEVQMDLIIAQGCRPLTSRTWTVDRMSAGDPTRIESLSCEGVARGRPLPALEAFQMELQSVLNGMTEAQLRRTVANLTVGVAPEGLKQTLEPQDFLIRSLRGFDSEQCLVVGDYLRAGQRVRFMVRDKQGAQEDLASHGLAFKRKQLQAMLASDVPHQPPPFGMLMFTCNGRGSGLYGEDSYDARTMSSYVPVPCAGFQCNGEIGRVGDTTHLHGFTCAVGLLRLTSEVAGAGTGASGVPASGLAPQPQQQQQPQQLQQPQPQQPQPEE